jgi:hypothetical protein
MSRARKADAALPRTTPSLADVEWMLEYHLLLARRYKRPLSLVMVESRGTCSPKDLLKNTIRESDVYFQFNDSLGAIVMTETDTRGALTAIARYKAGAPHTEALRFSAGCSGPDEDQTASRFLSTVYRRLKRAQNSGTTVADG